MRATLSIIPLFMLVGCASTPSPQAEAASHVRPIVAALQAYHRESGDYPEELAGLRPQYLPADVLVYDNSNARHSWFLHYQRIDQNHYMLYLDSTPCSQAVFKDGTFTAGYGPNFQ